MQSRKYMRRAFDVLRWNRQEAARLREMQGYLEEVAEQQQEGGSTAFYFWKTNTLHRYFHRLVDHGRAAKMARLLSKATLQLAFRALQQHSWAGRRSLEALARWQRHRACKTMFRCFSQWKQQVRGGNSHYQQVQGRLLLKQRALLSHCFSILQLEYKWGLVKALKAQRQHQRTLLDRSFGVLRAIFEQGRKLREKEDSLRLYLRYRRGTQFMRRLFQFYQQYTDYQRLAVKEARVRRAVVGLRAGQGLREWRNAQLRKEIYAVIKQRLRRLTER
jgi:hypothetical protein